MSLTAWVNIRHCLIFQVFKVPDSSSAETQDREKVAESILGYFAGFEAFSLPPPTADKELLKNIKDNKSQMDPFFQELDQFKSLLKSILTPKKSFNESELVTGEGTNIFVILRRVQDTGFIYRSNDVYDMQISSRY